MTQLKVKPLLILLNMLLVGLNLAALVWVISIGISLGTLSQDLLLPLILPVLSLIVLLNASTLRTAHYYWLAFIVLCGATYGMMLVYPALLLMHHALWTEWIQRVAAILNWYLPFILVLLVSYQLLIIPREENPRSRMPGVLIVLFQFLCLLVPTLCVLANVFHMSLTGILATSGLMTAIIGLALQSNLSNIFSGIFLSIDRPFELGDWITIGDQTGCVKDMAWRTTKIMTTTNVEVSIPNDVVNRGNIINWNHNDEKLYAGYKVLIDIAFHPHHDVQFLTEMLYDGLKQAKPIDGQAELALNSVKLIATSTEGLVFRLSTNCTNRLLDDPHRHEVISAIHRVAQQAGVRLTVGRILSTLDNDAGLTALNKVERTEKDYQPIRSPSSNIYFEALKNEVIIKQAPIFKGLTKELVKQLAKSCERQAYDIDAVIVKQHDEGDSLFILAEGVVKVCINQKNKKSIEVARLGVGDVFGEMALLTGEARTADVIAIRPVVALEVSKKSMAKLFKQAPKLYEHMADLLSERKLGLAAAYKHSSEEKKELKSLSQKFKAAILKFFN